MDAEIRTILCPLDLSPISDRELGLAVELARAFGARLVLQHNLSAAGPGMAKAWEWRQAHPKAETRRAADEKLRELATRVPPEVPVETLMTAGPLSIGVARLAEELPADLVVLGCHGSSSEDHSSLTELLLGRCACPILTLHEGGGHACTLHLGEGRERPLRVLVPTDFSPAGTAAARYACSLAERLGGEVHLLHVMEEAGPAVGSLLSMAPVGASDFSRAPARDTGEEALAAARERLAELVPEGMGGRVFRHVEPGRAEEAILRLAEAVAPDLIVMGEHARDPLRRFLTHDTARGVLHRAACPVWFIPPPRLAA